MVDSRYLTLNHQNMLTVASFRNSHIVIYFNSPVLLSSLN